MKLVCLALILTLTFLAFLPLADSEIIKKTEYQRLQWTTGGQCLAVPVIGDDVDVRPCVPVLPVDIELWEEIYYNPDQDTPIHLRVKSSGKCLTSVASFFVFQETCEQDNVEQMWTIRRDENAIKIVLETGVEELCLTVANSFRPSPQLGTCGRPRQHWRWLQPGLITSQNKALDLNGTDPNIF